jgi:SAM-dependent MidA family methyltransferase
MRVALTHPSLGYYSRVDRLLRYGGDFSTAPALSPFFIRTLARLLTELCDAALDPLSQAPAAGGGAGSSPALVAPAGLVELGGGEGHLAAGILGFWEQERPHLRDRLRYRIVEVGGRLRERQAATVRALMAAGWDISWGSDLEDACKGIRPVVMVGNEFLDTLPVHLIEVTGPAPREVYVEATSSGLGQAWGPLSQEAAEEVELLFGTLDPGPLRELSADGIVEVAPGLGDMMRRMAALMPSGSVVSIDYGKWFPDLGPACCVCGPAQVGRRRRSVRGYFKHQLALDPLARAGSQDLTADVDFAAVDLHGRREGFETVLFTTLGAFLRAGGAEAELARLRSATAETIPDPLEADRQATVLTHLMDEQDLGDAFKVMVQAKD